MDCQARLIAAVLGGHATLPPESERTLELEEHYTSLRRPEETHLLGSRQFDYCRDLGKRGGYLTPEFDTMLKLAEAIYKDVGSKRPAVPGGGDFYRNYEYSILSSSEYSVTDAITKETVVHHVQDCGRPAFEAY